MNDIMIKIISGGIPMKLKNLGIFLMLLFVLSLAACSNSQAESLEKEYSIPVGVEEGIISEEFYAEMYRFYDETEDLKWKQKEMIISMDGGVTDLALRKDITNLIEEYDTKLDSFDFKTNNQNEEEFAVLYNESIKLQKDLNVLMSAVLTTNDPVGYFVLTENELAIQELDDQILDLAKEYKLKEY